MIRHFSIGKTLYCFKRLITSFFSFNYNDFLHKHQNMTFVTHIFKIPYPKYILTTLCSIRSGNGNQYRYIYLL